MVSGNDALSAVYESIAFVGDALAPLFLEDPEKGAAGPSFEAFSRIDPAGAASEWPLGDCGAVKRGFEQMVSGLSAGVTDGLVWEYRRLFVGPGHKDVAPWGSVYTDYDGVIFGESTLELRAWMRAHGVARLAGEGDPDDHIGLMLALMAWLARNKPELLGEYLQDHFLTWAPHYLRKLEEEARHPFYRGLSLLTRTSLEGAGSMLEIQPASRRLYR